MVYSLPGAPTVVPSSLYSVPLSQYYQADPKAASVKTDATPQTPADKTPSEAKPTGKRGKKNKAKDADGKVVPSKDVPSSGDRLDVSDPLGRGTGSAKGFFAAFMSSDSECSDTEMSAGGGGTPNRLSGSYKAKVRLHSLACFHALIKVL